MSCFVQTKSYARIMTVMIPRETSTAQRLHDLEKKVDNGFAKVDERFAKVDERFEKVDERFDRLEDRFDALNRTLIGGAAVIVAALIGAPQI